jgi:predicted Zn-ribbon and HTH transcriptional regulator
MDKDNKILWDRFCRLGEMIGDGLHYEDKSISTEYKKLMKILLPPTDEEKSFYKEARKIKNKSIDEQMGKLLSVKKCDCGGEIKQLRSGSKAAKCQSCGQRFKAKVKKS